MRWKPFLEPVLTLLINYCTTAQDNYWCPWACFECSNWWFPYEAFQWIFIIPHIPLTLKLNRWIKFSLKNIANNSFSKRINLSKKPTNKWFSFLAIGQHSWGQFYLSSCGPIAEEIQDFWGKSDNKHKVTSSVTTTVAQQLTVVTDVKACLSSLDELCNPL